MRIAILGFATVALHSSPTLRAQTGSPVAIVVNRGNPVENLTLPQLRDLLVGKVTTWPNGKRVVVVLTDDADSRALVLKICCRQTPKAYDDAMLRAVFTGDIPATPRRVDTSEAVNKFVFNVVGGLGAVPADHLADSVKVVRIGGLAPTDAGYPLRMK